MILLDTHAWLWWLSDPGRLSAPALETIEASVEEDAVHISAISAWELALLVRRGRLELDRSVHAFVRATEALPFVHLVPIDARIALDSVGLDLPHQDPADRFIAATARLLGCPLVTRDRRLRESDAVRTVW